MRAALTFFRGLPELMRTTRHLPWSVRLRYLGACCRFYRDESAQADRRCARQPCGNPAMRASCCGPRPEVYPENRLPEDIPDLAAILQSAGSGWGGYIRFYDCTVCGQEWMLDWLPARHGGTRQLKKLNVKSADA